MTSLEENQQANFHTALIGLSLDRQAGGLAAQLGAALKEMVHRGVAPAGARLPATRRLAGELGVSRATVLAAFDQLLSEGYLEGRPGAGTFVAANLPDLLPDAAPDVDVKPEPIEKTDEILPLSPGLPDMALFPHRDWARHLQRAWQRPGADLLGTPPRFGYGPLRREIARHLQVWRGIRCAPGQVVITSGGAEAFRLLARLLPEGAGLGMEEPGYRPLRDSFAAAGHPVTALPVDEQGFDIEGFSGEAGLVAVTPSRQYPLGMTMPLARRMRLLEWAEARDGLILEDDYDSEFRFEGVPIPALTSLDRAGRCFYAGSFSKTFFSGLRVGYLVVPERFLPALRRDAPMVQASLVPQPALAEFMASGGYARHLRRMRRTYGARRRAMLTQLRAAGLAPVDQPSGMHLLLPVADDARVARRACAAGLGVRALSSYYAGPPRASGLILGFSAHDEAIQSAAVARLMSLL